MSLTQRTLADYPEGPSKGRHAIATSETYYLSDGVKILLDVYPAELRFLIDRIVFNCHYAPQARALRKQFRVWKVIGAGMPLVYLLLEGAGGGAVIHETFDRRMEEGIKNYPRLDMELWMDGDDTIMLPQEYYKK